MLPFWMEKNLKNILPIYISPPLYNNHFSQCMDCANLLFLASFPLWLPQYVGAAALPICFSIYLSSARAPPRYFNCNCKWQVATEHMEMSFRMDWLRLEIFTRRHQHINPPLAADRTWLMVNGQCNVSIAATDSVLISVICGDLRIKVNLSRFPLLWL